MAAVSVIVGYKGSDDAPVMRTSVESSEVVTSSAVSAQSVGVAGENTFWEIACATNLWVTFGTNPTAAAGTTFLVFGGSPRQFQARKGDKVAVVDA